MRLLLDHRQRSIALHCCRPKAHAKFNQSTPCKIVTPENIVLKLCTRDYVGKVTCHANFGFNRNNGGFSPNWAKYYHLVTFLTVMSFSILRPGRTAGPIFTLYGSNDVFPRKDGPWGLERWATIFGEIRPQNPQNGRE